MFGMCAVKMNAKSYQLRPPERCFTTAEQEKKFKYLDSCLQHQRQFYPFVTPVNGLLGVEDEATLKQLASHITTKWKQPYSCTFGYVWSRVSITLARFTHCCIRGYQVPEIWISVQIP